MSKSERLIYIPLGGAGEIGMNMYVYGYGPAGKERLILVDCGVTFPSMDGTPGVDLIMADPSWIEERADRLEAIFITHAHEDHVGALGLLHGKFGVPVYARAFTATIARNKMVASGADDLKVKTVAAFPQLTSAGPFRVGFVPISHSIPEASALVIETPAGKLIHSGDFKIDATPVVGEAFEEAVIAAASVGGVKALICDSTNVFSPHDGRSEALLAEPIRAMMAAATGAFVATTFASNIARLKTLAEAAQAAGRKIVVLGRAMNTMLDTAREVDLLGKFPRTIDVEEAESLPRNQLFMMATGSQGEARAASAQLARGKYMGLELKKGDTFLFSSKTIPGNEVSVGRIMNDLSRIGVRVVDGEDGTYHVSGHANRPDLLKMHGLVNPEMVIPMHGEHRHLREHSELAEAHGRQSMIVTNGTMIDLTGNKPEVVDQIEQGRVYLDGSVLIGAMDGIIRSRMQMAIRGHVIVSVSIDDAGRLADPPWADLVGLADRADLSGGLARMVEDAVEDQLAREKPRNLLDDGNVEEVVRRACYRVCRDLIGKKPLVTVMIARLED